MKSTSNSGENQKQPQEPQLVVADWRIQEWEQIYAPLNVAGEIDKMKLWLAANPKRAKKKNWMRFVINWLNKAHAQVVTAQVQARMAARVGTTRPKVDVEEQRREMAEILERHPDLRGTI